VARTRVIDVQAALSAFAGVEIIAFAGVMLMIAAVVKGGGAS
jgi:hypothetical protein